jgi:hypothetical protein
LKIGAGLTVTVAVAGVLPMLSCMVMVTAVFAATAAGSNTTVDPLTACGRGRAVLLLENAW